jgi:hypothetical protein
MVNFGLNWARLLEIVLALAGMGRSYLRSVPLEFSVKLNIIAWIAIACGLAVIVQGWQLVLFSAIGAAIVLVTNIHQLRDSNTDRSTTH